MDLPSYTYVNINMYLTYMNTHMHLCVHASALLLIHIHLNTHEYIDMNMYLNSQEYPCTEEINNKKPLPGIFLIYSS